MEITIPIAISILGLLITYFGWVVRQNDRLTKLESLEANGCPRIQSIEKIVTRIDTQLQPFWAIVEGEVAKSLHHDDTPEYDALLNRLNEPMSLNDLLRLDELLGKDLDSTRFNGGPKSQTLAIASVKARVMWRIEEARKVEANTE